MSIEVVARSLFGQRYTISFDPSSGSSALTNPDHVTEQFPDLTGLFHRLGSIFDGEGGYDIHAKIEKKEGRFQHIKVSPQNFTKITNLGIRTFSLIRRRDPIADAG